MKTWDKVGIGVGGLVVAGAIVLYSVNQANKGVVTVQTAKVAKQDLTSVVTASGEIKPETYTNMYGEGFGKIIGIVVKEGDHVKRGDVLLRLENVQPSADVDAQQAGLNSAESAVQSAEANYRAAHADVTQRKADLERARLDWERAQGLYKDGLIPKADFDKANSAYQSADAAVDSSSARSEEHTSELQSRLHLVCRLLLEKKKHSTLPQSRTTV